MTCVQAICEAYETLGFVEKHCHTVARNSLHTDRIPSDGVTHTYRNALMVQIARADISP